MAQMKRAAPIKKWGAGRAVRREAMGTGREAVGREAMGTGREAVGREAGRAKRRVPRPSAPAKKATLPLPIRHRQRVDSSPAYFEFILGPVKRKAPPRYRKTLAIESILRCQVYLGVLSDVVRNIGEASGIIHRCDCGQLMVIAFQRSVQTCPDCGKEWCNYHKNGSDSCWVPKREECSWWWTCPCIMSDQSNHEKLGIAIGRIGGAVVGECSS